MDECGNCGFLLLPGEQPCPECMFGSEDWEPDGDDRDDDPGPGPYIATTDATAQVFSGP